MLKRAAISVACIFGGTGIEKDNMEAAKWLKKAADLGDEIAVDYLNKYLSEEYEIFEREIGITLLQVLT